MRQRHPIPRWAGRAWRRSLAAGSRSPSARLRQTATTPAWLPAGPHAPARRRSRCRSRNPPCGAPGTPPQEGECPSWGWEKLPLSLCGLRASFARTRLPETRSEPEGLAGEPKVKRPERCAGGQRSGCAQCGRRASEVFGKSETTGGVPPAERHLCFGRGSKWLLLSCLHEPLPRVPSSPRFSVPP